MSIRLHHFAITVKDIEISIDFYLNKLGFQIDGEDTRSQKYIYLKIGNSNVFLELVESSDSAQKYNFGNMNPHLALDSNDIENDLKRLENRGVESINGLQIIPGDVKIFTLIDPDGYHIDVGQKIT